MRAILAFRAETTSRSPDMHAQQIHATVEQDFEAVDRLIKEQLSSRVPLVEHIGQYITESGGKRMRPLLVLLIANALGHSDAGHIKLATIIEFLHTATLLHDDVVDTSDMRRGRSTANAKWGNAPSVLVGDFLYSRAFEMMVQLGSLPIMTILSQATNIIAEGEVLQLANVRNPDLSEAQYIEVIRSKTAMLFQAASHSAAVLAGATPETEAELRDFGLYLGMAFQLVDDVLDYQGSAEEMGKNVGDDLAEGKTTLPLIYTLQNGTPAQQQLVRQAIRQGGLDQLDSILAAVTDCGALAYTMEQAHNYVDKAEGCLRDLPDSEYRDALLALARLAVTRSK